ncbi:Lys-63-specific deubiquitinase BRCC36 [Oopsacas minuta]|uniref:Lys-63-specific deubiquitinase BRCC36 n=1 Tax=Oopsacas minuta TaxID=111878 RepID=A0AAV7K144_9METZ|nr:Lys-63-specific deubiquitinase BRCC36 [Oopsacas minuta]
MLCFVWLSADAYFVCMTHALSTEKEEIMGLLLGETLPGDTVWIYGVFMMRRSDKRADRVEISPEQLSAALTESQTLSQELGKEIRVLGWYHSHPHITISPSHVDVRTQHQYQSLDPNFFGLIVSAFHEEMDRTSSIKITCFQADKEVHPTHEVFIKKEIPFAIQNTGVSIGSACLNAYLQLPRILFQEEEEGYRQFQGNDSQDFLTTVYNGSVYTQNMERILTDICNPVLRILESHLQSQQQLIKTLEDEKDRLVQEMSGAHQLIIMGCGSSKTKSNNIQVLVAPTRGDHSSNSDPLGLSTRTASSSAVITGQDPKPLYSSSRPPSNTSVSTGSVASPPAGFYRDQASSQSKRSSRPASSSRRDVSGLRRRSTTPAILSFSGSGRFSRTAQIADREREKDAAIFKVDSADESLAILTPSLEQTDLDCSQNLGESRNRSLNLSFTAVTHSIPSRLCPLCQSLFSTKGTHTPLLLICGHSFCKTCLDKITCNPDIDRIRCPCGVDTSVELQSEFVLARNQALLELLEIEQLHSQKLVARKEEGCAECESAAATRWCCECGAPYCESCCLAAHEKLRVLSHHKPLPISQRPLPAPMCKAHPGQSYKLYCETDQVPMCLMCKYSNQHRGHQFDLLTRTSQRYITSLQDQLSNLRGIKADMTRCSSVTHHKWSFIREEARVQQNQLEAHFSALRKDLLSTLDLRENRLLNLLDSQVQAKQDMTHEFMLDLCLGMSRVIAAEQEAERLLTVNPVTLLLSRHHMDEVMSRVLMLNLASLSHNEPPIPMSLPKSTSDNLKGLITTHGDVLQLPGEPWFTDVRVGPKKIHIEWEAISIPEKGDQKKNKSFSLHFFASLKNAKRQAISEDLNHSKHLMEYVGWRARSQRGNRAEGVTEVDSGVHSASIDYSNSSQGRHSIPPVQPDEAVLPPPSASNHHSSHSSFESFPQTPSSQRPIKLPPLIKVKTQEESRSILEGSFNFQDETTPLDHPVILPERGQEESGCSDESVSSQGSDFNRFEYDHERSPATPYQEAYSGTESRFTHKNLIAGGTYYYRVRCKNSAGWGPWSKVLKCTTKSSTHRRASFTIMNN